MFTCKLCHHLVVPSVHQHENSSLQRLDINSIPIFRADLDSFVVEMVQSLISKQPVFAMTVTVRRFPRVSMSGSTRPRQNKVIRMQRRILVILLDLISRNSLFFLCFSLNQKRQHQVGRTLLVDGFCTADDAKDPRIRYQYRR